jgi:hypothetical protein
LFSPSFLVVPPRNGGRRMEEGEEEGAETWRVIKKGRVIGGTVI